LILLIIGKIVAPQGIRGELRVLSYSDFPDRFLKAGERMLLKDEFADPQVVHILSGYAIKANLFVVKLLGVDDRNHAESLRDYLLAVPSSDLPPLDEDEFHFSELIDCVVIHQPTQQTIGKVTAVLESGNSVLEVQGGAGVGLSLIHI
jgi:16S rRNA processing protein RimM